MLSALLRAIPASSTSLEGSSYAAPASALQKNICVPGKDSTINQGPRRPTPNALTATLISTSPSPNGRQPYGSSTKWPPLSPYAPLLRSPCATCCHFGPSDDTTNPTPAAKS
jgi:hypothetical protein